MKLKPKHSQPSPAPEDVPFRITLKRDLTFPLVLFFGLGNIIGAGIYVLTGEVAGLAGVFAPLSFLIAAGTAALTAFSYAELSARYPKAAGDALYVFRGFRQRWLAAAVGYLIVFSGIVSAAAIAHGFSGYVRALADLPAEALTVGILLFLGAAAGLRVGFSLGIVAALTILELLGLVVVIASASFGAPILENLGTITVPDQVVAPGILAGAFLAFYAFIGFEDMVNLAEETRNPTRTMPRALLTALAVATVLYGLTVTVAVGSVPAQELAASEAPLALVVERSGGPAALISLVSIVAVAGGILVQMVMGSRLLYGMARRGWAPRALGHVSRLTRTPLRTTALVVAAMVAFAAFFPLVTLAEFTSTGLLTVFILVNLALLRIKRRSPRPRGVRTYPAAIPVAGAVVSALLLLSQFA